MTVQPPHHLHCNQLDSVAKKQQVTRNRCHKINMHPAKHTQKGRTHTHTPGMRHPPACCLCSTRQQQWCPVSTAPPAPHQSYCQLHSLCLHTPSMAQCYMLQPKGALRGAQFEKVGTCSPCMKLLQQAPLLAGHHPTQDSAYMTETQNHEGHQVCCNLSWH